MLNQVSQVVALGMPCQVIRISPVYQCYCILQTQFAWPSHVFHMKKKKKPVLSLHGPKLYFRCGPTSLFPKAITYKRHMFLFLFLFL